jgi:hypothetical protein
MCSGLETEIKKIGILHPDAYIAVLPTTPECTTATFTDNNAVLATDSDPAIASQKLQTDLLATPKLV